MVHDFEMLEAYALVLKIQAKSIYPKLLFGVIRRKKQGTLLICRSTNVSQPGGNPHLYLGS